MRSRPRLHSTIRGPFSAVLASLLWAVPAPAVDLFLPGTQSTPGRLDASLAHESRAALDRGLAWLAAQQKADGGWDGTERPDLTALAVQVFKASPDPDHRPIRERAERYLASRTPTNRSESAWAILALTQRLDRATGMSSTTAGTFLFSRMAAGATLKDRVVQKAFDWIAAHPEMFQPTALSVEGHADLLLLTMALAQSGQNRIPLADHSLLSWRPLIARTLINRQKTDPVTGGLYWQPVGQTVPNDTLAATCYALLTLQVVLAE
jgi:hypothetical protein